MKLNYIAAEGDTGRKVYGVLCRELSLSQTQIKRIKREGALTVNGAVVCMDYRLRPEDMVEIDLGPLERAPDYPPESGELEVLYEDEWLLAVNKPQGMLVHPSHSRYTGTLANFVGGYLLERTGSAVCHAVNRLDRDTSGVVLFAKNAHMNTLAVRALREADSGKVYRALLYGGLDGDRGVIDAPIEREAEGQMRRIVTPSGKRAVTEYETVRRGSLMGVEVSEVRFRLETGRTHQIRVHCAHMGAPILGDTIYGTEESRALSIKLMLAGQQLHAQCISLREPVTGRDLKIEAPLRRADMRRLLSLLKVT